MREGKKEIVTRLIFVYVAVLLVWAIAIISFIVKIQFVEGDFWRERADMRTVALRDVNAQRGNIISSDGNLLGISVPIFTVAVDLGKEMVYNKERKEMVAEYIIPDSVFNKRNLSTLCQSLETMFPKLSAKDYEKKLTVGRKKMQRYVILAENVNLEQLEQMKKFPILKKEIKPKKPKKNTDGEDSTQVKKPKPIVPQFNRAVILVQSERRINPYGELGRKTIGFKDTEKGCDTCYNGIDGYYNNYLKGKKGKRMERRINQNVWVPIEDKEYKRAEDGNDVLSTIDVGIQQLAEKSLRACLDSNNADKGCVVLMEVETGYIRAISNLTRNTDGRCRENGQNIAISDRYEPGSTFKAVTAMILLENGVCDTSYRVPTGSYVFRSGKTATSKKDVNAKEGVTNYASLKRAFEVSSNVGMCYPVFEYYGKGKRDEYHTAVTNLFPLQKLDLDINVEQAKPTITNDMAPDNNFLNLCYGYGVDMSVMHLLTFYNAIANNGKMIKPMFASHILHAGDTIETLKTQVLNEKICSNKTLAIMQDLLKSVVKNGSARLLSKTPYGIAGKTGTAQSGYADKNGVITSRASFVGYFPADNPKYSCMVLVVNPKKNKTHGGDLAAPVFREIADRVCGIRLDIEIPITAKEDRKMPFIPKAYLSDLEVILKTLQIPITPANKKIWVNVTVQNDSVFYSKATVSKNSVPSVQGMTIKDALYMLESIGLKVFYSGRGKVTQQSIANGEPFKKGDAIYLVLN